MENKILDFVGNRPSVKAAYGYGSGVFKQNGYNEQDKPQLDLILVVDNLKKWHLENMKLNKGDYSFIGKNFFEKGKIEHLKGMTGITYMSNIEENNSVFKYGTIELDDLKRHLYTWDSFYIPGRFQKTIFPIIENDDLSDAINYNRSQALFIASYLQDKNEVYIKDLLVTLCNLSYLGDTRMKLAENPRKVLNIVEGSFDKYKQMYDFNYPYLLKYGSKVIINRGIMNEYLKYLPDDMRRELAIYYNQNEEEIKANIIKYLTNLNKRESINQTLKGVKTNGIVRSLDYASKKISKRFKTII